MEAQQRIIDITSFTHIHRFTTIQKEAKRRNGVFRTPHYSISENWMLSELAIAAGGVLFLDCVEDFHKRVLQCCITNWTMMHQNSRPTLLLAFGPGRPESEKARILKMVQETADAV